MNLSNQQKFFLHNVLFSYLADHPHLDRFVKDQAEELMSSLEESLLEQENLHHEDEEDDESSDELDDYGDHEDEDYESSHADVYLNNELYDSLPSLRVEDPHTGERSTLKFLEVSSGNLGFSLTSKGTDIVIDDVLTVKRGGKSLTVEVKDDDPWEFNVSKFPVEWTDSLPVNKVTAP